MDCKREESRDTFKIISKKALTDYYHAKELFLDFLSKADVWSKEEVTKTIIDFHLVEKCRTKFRAFVKSYGARVKFEAAVTSDGAPKKQEYHGTVTVTRACKQQFLSHHRQRLPLGKQQASVTLGDDEDEGGTTLQCAAPTPITTGASHIPYSLDDAEHTAAVVAAAHEATVAGNVASPPCDASGSDSGPRSFMLKRAPLATGEGADPSWTLAALGLARADIGRSCEVAARIPPPRMHEDITLDILHWPARNNAAAGLSKSAPGGVEAPSATPPLGGALTAWMERSSRAERSFRHSNVGMSPRRTALSPRPSLSKLTSTSKGTPPSPRSHRAVHTRSHSGTDELSLSKKAAIANSIAQQASIVSDAGDCAMSGQLCDVAGSGAIASHSSHTRGNASENLGCCAFAGDNSGAVLDPPGLARRGSGSMDVEVPSLDACSPPQREPVHAAASAHGYQGRTSPSFVTHFSGLAARVPLPPPVALSAFTIAPVPSGDGLAPAPVQKGASCAPQRGGDEAGRIAAKASGHYGSGFGSEHAPTAGGGHGGEGGEHGGNPCEELAMPLEGLAAEGDSEFSLRVPNLQSWSQDMANLRRLLSTDLSERGGYEGADDNGGERGDAALVEHSLTPALLQDVARVYGSGSVGGPVCWARDQPHVLRGAPADTRQVVATGASQLQHEARKRLSAPVADVLPPLFGWGSASRSMDSHAEEPRRRVSSPSPVATGRPLRAGGVQSCSPPGTAASVPGGVASGLDLDASFGDFACRGGIPPGQDQIGVEPVLRRWLGASDLSGSDAPKVTGFF